MKFSNKIALSTLLLPQNHETFFLIRLVFITIRFIYINFIVLDVIYLQIYLCWDNSYCIDIYNCKIHVLLKDMV